MAEEYERQQIERRIKQDSQAEIQQINIEQLQKTQNEQLQMQMDLEHALRDSQEGQKKVLTAPTPNGIQKKRGRPAFKHLKQQLSQPDQIEQQITQTLNSLTQTFQQGNKGPTVDFVKTNSTVGIPLNLNYTKSPVDLTREQIISPRLNNPFTAPLNPEQPSQAKSNESKSVGNDQRVKQKRGRKRLAQGKVLTVPKPAIQNPASFNNKINQSSPVSPKNVPQQRSISPLPQAIKPPQFTGVNTNQNPVSANAMQIPTALFQNAFLPSQPVTQFQQNPLQALFPQNQNSQSLPKPQKQCPFISHIKESFDQTLLGDLQHQMKVLKQQNDYIIQQQMHIIQHLRVAQPPLPSQ
ncbi:hypothetical protein FGO68_gene12353 [Halteria grandinella]|uniref:Uncharacterized protein n=1 Tax=Halteria grandinella TaxID=5974 RepID=A0A8J8P3K2_HALGN|nr:hypothetical protein FGO68_gene12353 [Halteria grandinella]